MNDPRDDVRMWQPSKHASCEIYAAPLPVTERKLVLQTNRPEDRDKVLTMRDALVVLTVAADDYEQQSVTSDDELHEALRSALAQAEAILGGWE